MGKPRERKRERKTKGMGLEWDVRAKGNGDEQKE